MIEPEPDSDVSVVELSSRVADGELFTILDVRERHERAHCAIRFPPLVRDLHVPIGEIVRNVEAIKEASAGRPLVVYCHHGIRSQAAAQWLAGQGLATVLNLRDGIDAWSRFVDPTVPRY